jgi:hypothetical protein
MEKKKLGDALDPAKGERKVGRGGHAGGGWPAGGWLASI